MAIAKTVPNPFGVAPIDAYIRLIETSLNHADQVGRVVFGVYDSAEARSAGKPPVSQISYAILPAPQPAEVDAQGVITRPAIPSYTQLIAAHADIYLAEKAAIYNAFGSQPELAGGTEV